ncbi:unnamed protein product [Cladocopium goreaui]|uniref:RRM domain-containing protein n=1 Tax=Cladocopium goreaui TaxID=2562237 RepID=A0A9P1BPS9_9DINO|nr:unnamed protein product [Cladocopium goreaui]
MLQEVVFPYQSSCRRLSYLAPLFSDALPLPCGGRRITRHLCAFGMETCRATKARSAKPPKNTPDLKAPVFAGYAQVPGKRSGSKPPEIEDFSKTSTPMPEGAATMFGEDQPSAQREHQMAANKTRPRSGSRMGNSASMCDLERTPSTSAPMAAVEYDPMGSSFGKRRFGGRG